MKETNKRKAILDAAFSVVAMKGYAATKVDDIAAAAGVAKGTVYLYFKDKPDIYVGLVGLMLSRALDIIREIDSNPLSPSEKLARVFAVWTKGMHERPSIVPFISMESINLAAYEVARFTQAIKPRVRELIEALANIIRPGIEHGEFRQVDPYMAALMFLHCFPMNIVVHRQKLAVKNPSAKTLDMYFHGILPPEQPKDHRKPL